MGFRADLRAGCVTMLTAYAASANLKLQIYKARPRSLHPPTAFVDSITETTTLIGPTSLQRTPTARVVVIHGLFDSADTADQADAFVDGFLAWVTANYHAAGANTLVGDLSMEDDPTFVPDWVPLSEQRTYFATVISVEGFAGV